MRFYPMVILIHLLMLFAVSGCKEESTTSDLKTAVVKIHLVDPTLAYSGRIQPTDSVYIASPVNGFVDKMMFAYGDQVHKGQVLFQISDPKIESDFVEKVITFLKNKDDLSQAKRKLSAEKDMLKAGIISEDDFLKNQTHYENTYISFAKSSIALRKIAILVGVPYTDIQKLKLSDLDAIEKLLLKQPYVTVRAERDGRILSPSVVQGHNDDKKKLVMIGSKVEKGQMLAISVNKHGFQITLKVDEHEITRIKKGMKVSISASVYGRHNLHGHVADVHIFDMQKGSSSDQMVFPVTIKLDALQASDIQKTYLGMHVKAMIHLGAQQRKTVPINAIFSKQNQYWVNVLDQDQHVKNVMVTTGQTTASDVVVSGDLKAGDRVVLHD